MAQRDESYWKRVTESAKKWTDPDDSQQISEWLDGWGGVFFAVLAVAIVVAVVAVQFL